VTEDKELKWLMDSSVKLSDHLKKVSRWLAVVHYTSKSLTTFLPICFIYFVTRGL
jgi:hypothetical protein